MEVQELKQLIKSNNVPNFLIFIGEEWKVQEIYIEQIAKVKKLNIKHIDRITEVWSALQSKSLFSQNYLYVVRDDKELMTTEKLYKQLTDVLKNNTLILVLTSVDKRLKFIKTYNKSLVEFNALKSEILKRYIQKDIPLNDRNCEILMDICQHNYGRCLLEIDKFIDYATANEDNPQVDSVNKVFDRLLQDGTIHIPPKDVIWDFIKAVLQNKPNKAYELYQDLKELQEPTLAILTNLYNNTKQVLQVQICKSNDIAKTTGLTAWQIRNAKECVGKWDSNDLAYLMRLIQKVEKGIKIGEIDESIAVEYILADMW